MSIVYNIFGFHLWFRQSQMVFHNPPRLHSRICCIQCTFLLKIGDVQVVYCVYWLLSRPIEITANKEKIVKTVLVNSRKLKSKQEDRNIGMSPGRTSRQLELFKKVKQEVTNNFNAGDTKCRWKYFNEIPRVGLLN